MVSDNRQLKRLEWGSILPFSLFFYRPWVVVVLWPLWRGGLECEGPDQREIDLCKLLLTDSGYINSWAMRTNKPTP
jgi:hypothetical protein